MTGVVDDVFDGGVEEAAELVDGVDGGGGYFWNGCRSFSTFRANLQTSLNDE